MIVIEELVDTIKKSLNEDLNEISVREEIINPLLKLLGYESSKKNIIREARFEKIDIMIGSKKDNRTYQADYYLEAYNHKKWILEVKNTSYKIDEKSFRQAFSYAIHPKVNAELFAVCNGREFVLYSVQKRNKIFSFALENLIENYSLLSDFLSCETLDDNMDFLKDFGLYLKSKNYTENDVFEIFMDNIKFIDVADENTIYINTPVQYDNEKFFASFKIEKPLFISAHRFFADTLKLVKSKNKYPISIPLYDNRLAIHFQCKISRQIMEAEKELYLPLIIINFIDVKLNE